MTTFRGALLALLLGASFTAGAAIVPPDQVERKIATRLEVNDGRVSGTLTNLSDRSVRNVRLLIEHAWLWNHESRPGDEDLGRLEVVTIPQELAPGASATFTQPLETPLARRTDGRYVTTATVIGLEEIERR